MWSNPERDTLWHPVYGERSSVRDYYHEVVVHLGKADLPKQELHLVIRAYNEGIAMRYFFPEQPEGGAYVRITLEKTEFTLPDETIAYVAPFAQADYRAVPLTSWSTEAERPLTLVLKSGLYACLAEAEMVNYSITKFKLSTEKPNTIQCSQYDAVEETAPFATPWRVIMVAEKAGDLLEHNDLILNLNPPCAIDRPGWIKPGKVIREITLSTTGAKASINFAAQHNIQYVEFFEQVPTVWDETKVIHGEIGKYITIARRSGDRWFIGAITNVEQRTLEIPLSFLPKGKHYQASIYSDDRAVPTRTKVRIDRKQVDASSIPTATSLPSGGEAIRLESIMK
ncbi:MAG: glycoside hydrolase family 97 N-terminal domain-containing protein [bacterium]